MVATPASSLEQEHYFTAHTNARLTFMIGIVIGMSIMTVSAVGFFAYLFAGGEVKSYAIAPLDTDSQILVEPIKEVTNSDEITLAETDTNHVFGAQENYTTTLVYYSDYECRFCKKFFPEVLAVINAHSDTVRLVMKYNPLVQIHPHAKAASLAAYCAAEQGKLLEYSEALYHRQDELADDSIFNAIAFDLKLDHTAFTTCRGSEAAEARVEADAQEATGVGIQTQPNLLIMHTDGQQQVIDGYVNQSYLESALGY